MKKLRLSKVKIEMEREKKKKRKKPPIRTLIHHKFEGNKYGDKVVTKEERDAIIYPLGKSKFKGRGLPERVKKENECEFHTLNFEIRMKHGDKDDEIELGFALTNSDTHTLKVYDDLEGVKSCKAKGDFTRNLYKTIYETTFILAEACVKNQTEDFENKREFLKEITEHFSNQYKEILGLGFRKTIETSFDENGMKVEKSVFIDYGAKPQTKAELEREKREFLDSLYYALNELKKKRIEKPKQKDLMRYMFMRYSDREKKISEMLKKHNLKFKQTLYVFNATNLEDFINNMMRIT